MKYLVAGLGNFGEKYKNTRHNIGFTVLDALASASNIFFRDTRYAFRGELKYKARTLILIKPTTYMNLSGLAVNYWLKNEKIPLENLIVVVDDIALPFGSIRLKPKGGDAGHNGLRNITEIIGTQDYPRLRFGIGNDFFSGQQANYVLSPWDFEETKNLQARVEIAVEVIKSFATKGLQNTMNEFNNK
ncbi:MAG: aminoacyl-tRNA hydrolase [Bacteroidales bacterium]|nr:aminoacyl-tRNA hydrolase [Bacteroidales bacterium]